MTRHQLMKKCNKFWIVLSLAICMLFGKGAEADDYQTDSTIASHKLSKYKLGGKWPAEGQVFSVDDSGLHGLEAKSADEIMTLTWHDAVEAVKAYGSDWRLPTSAELLSLYEQRMLVGGFSNDDYWSSTEQDINSAWIQGFRNGDQDRYNKHSKLRVRAVRSF